MEDRRLPANTSVINRGTAIDVCAAIQQQLRRFEILVLGRYVQERGSLEREGTSARRAEIEFRESPVQ
jgi:hypothetical protein